MINEFEDKLLIQLLELQHGAIEISELKETCSQVDWAKGFPESKEAFWNCAAFMWQRKIKKDKREMIKLEIQNLLGTSKHKNIDIGSGSYSYIPSVAFDCSKKMLDFNDSVLEKVQGDIEAKWPFENESFETVTAVFVLNYLKNLDLVFSEIKRVLNQNGKLIAVISATGVTGLHKAQEKQQRSFESWKELFSNYFAVEKSYKKDGLWFFCLELLTCLEY